jgi:phage baseplate assembly protein W
MNLDFPLSFDPVGHTSQTDDNDHIRNMIEQLLFTSPGERVNRPTLGSGLLQLVFQPSSDALANTTQFLVQGALQQWLGDLIAVSDVQISRQDSTFQVTVSYTVRTSQQSFTASFSN